MKDRLLIFKRKWNAIYNAPAKIIVFSFLLVVLIGGLLLSLPISSNNGMSTGFLNSLFTAVSATCVTGLSFFDTYTQWSLFGQLVILALIQIGGLGVVTISIFFYVVAGKKLGLRGMHLAKESINVPETEGLNDLFKFIVRMTFCVEFIGAVILSLVFVKDYGFLKGIYISIFLAISSFCNAGFDVLGFRGPFTGLTEYNNNPIVIYTVGCLIILGSLGFIVWYDMFHNNKKRKFLFHTKVVLIMTSILVFLGAVIFFIMEYDNELTFKNLSLCEKINAAFFQSITLRTAGFSSVDVSKLRQSTKALASIIMFVGGAPGSTSGGIKVTTLAVLIMTVICNIQNKPDTMMFKHKVDKKIVYRSISMFFMSIVVVLVGTGILYYSTLYNESLNIIDFMFETISAFSTVGLSVGVTAQVNVVGAIALMVMMFMGRVGPISLLLSVATKNNDVSYKIYPEGRIMVT